ncbi:SDR family oxidoreductase [Nocardia sp. 348MFTsu5.1]|jgi:NAD(P)-dependent dehydrogenase (short-subunit alcohol dehydrogenase family)|uniref:SDR family oxidoreductase n=1 Tax=Nocardia sp. 348MFTsu5.1 TaxID=1172185 RepID=UPI0003689398|nr:SDR family oxidoreductase [Nocardia sp. 348MFTsu5.1]
MVDLKDATVLVTGANGGLGTEFVNQALALGARRVYAAARNPREWSSDRIVPLRLDVTDAESIAAAAQEASDVDVVINNAGTLLPGKLLDQSIDEIRGLMDTNVYGPLLVTKAFAPVLASRGGGAVLNVHSVLSWLAIGGSYSVSKAALWMTTNVLRLELASQGTQVVGLHLGYTDTPMVAGVDAEKNDPADVVRDAYAGLEAGATEVLADDVSAAVKAGLAGPIEALYPQVVG